MEGGLIVLAASIVSNGILCHGFKSNPILKDLSCMSSSFGGHLVHLAYREVAEKEKHLLFIYKVGASVEVVPRCCP